MMTIRDCSDHTRWVGGEGERVVFTIEMDCRMEDDFGSLITTAEVTTTEACGECGQPITIVWLY